MSGNTSPRGVASTPLGLSSTELDTYAQYAWLSGRVGEAIDLYSDLARLYRRSPHVHFKLGYLYLSLHDNTAAVKHFALEIERHGDDVVEPSTSTESRLQQQQQRAFLFCTYAGRSDALTALGETSKAEMDQLFITNRNGHSQPMLLAMGQLYFRFGMHQRADTCFEQYAALGGSDSEYFVEHAELRLAQRRYPLAASMFEKCRHHTSSTSPTYHRALIGEGAALMRQDKLQDAIILLLQAMNTLRNTIRTTISQGTEPNTPGDATVELVLLYHRAVNMYGGLCLMKGELKAALDTFCSIFQSASSFAEIVPFHLPTMCLTPGTRNQNGDTVDSTKISTKNLGESIRHLNEMEWRYGPDPCLYFHRANLHRATGAFEAFVHDLSLVESMDPNFLSQYVKRDYLGDFLDTETISWIPTWLVESIHDALERVEYRIPVTFSAPAPVNTNGSKLKSKNANLPQQKPRSFSEVAMLLYLRERVKMNKNGDEYAQVIQLDVFRRLPESKRGANQLNMFELAQWEGVIFDDVYADDEKSVGDQSLHDCAQSTIATNSNHPCAYMFAGMIALERFDVDVACKYFTDAIDLVDKKTSPKPVEGSAAVQSSLSQRWFQQLLQRVKYYSLVWRSVTCRVKIEMEKAVEDLNVAAAVRLGAQQGGVDDPFLVVQRTLIMLFNGHLKAAYKLLRVLKKCLRLARRSRLSSGLPVRNEAAEVIDMFSSAGLNSFYLLPLQVQKESSRLMNAHTAEPLEQQKWNGASEELNANDRADEEKEEREEEATAISMVKYALTKKAVPQTEMLDKFYESGILKLSVTGSISQVIPFFQAVLSIDEGYLPPTNFASLEIFKCKEQDFMEEKLFNCFVRLGKRSKWLDKKIKWRFEALIDENLAHAYLPTDMETLWHRARLLQGQHNYLAAINDLTDCLQLMTAHYSWERGKQGEKASFANETKRTQWLQLQLERGVLYMELHRWDQAIDDLTMVIAQAGKKNSVLRAGAYDARSNCLIRMKRYGHAIQDLQYLLALSDEGKKAKNGAVEDVRRREDRMLNCVLIGNLYCQLAVDQMKAGSALARKTSVTMNPLAMKQTKLAHINMGFIKRAGDFYDEAEAMIPDHFLVHYFRGRMCALSGQSQLATKSLTQCLRLHTMFLPALFLRGCIYAEENLFVLALADFYRVRHRITTYPNLHTTIGYCHLERGSLTKAIESFTEGILQRHDDADALYMRGCALQELMVLESAVKDFIQVVTINPDYYRAHYQLAVCYLLLKNYKSATHAVNEFVRLQPEWRDAWILHGYAHFCAERYETAVFSYGSAISFPDSSEGADRSRQQDSTLFLFRAVSYMKCEKFTAALTDLDLALKRDNENYVAFIAKAYCLAKTGDRSRAAQTLAHCLPQYKFIKLPPAADILDSERIKELAKAEASIEIHASAIASGAPSSSGSSSTTATATAGKIFHYRKVKRDSEPKQIMRPLSVILGERRTSSTDLLTELCASASNSPERPMAHAVPDSAQSPQRKSRRFSHFPAASHPGTDDDVAKARAKKILRTKFLRAMKKITFQYRVLKALEDATSAKYKKSQELTRTVSDIVRPANRVPWPKGTLTSRILLWAFNEFGIHHASERRVDDALMAFTLAIQSHARNSDTHFNRGNVYLQINLLHSAASGFQDAIEEDENCFRARNNMGVAYYKLKRYEEAHDAFSTGLHHAEDHKERAILLYNLGATLQALERPEEALDFYQQAIALDASRTEFFNNRSAILHHQMRFAVALEDYNRALTLQEPQALSAHSTDESDNGVAARLNRAQLYIAMGNCTLASRDLTVVLKSLTDMRDNLPHDQDRDVTMSFTSADTEAKLEVLEADIRLATDLLAFSRKWRTAMRIAVKDFLFALHALPCLAIYEFSPLLGPELVRLQEEEAERMYAGDFSDDPADGDRLQFVPLPIQDTSFFNYERDFGHWIMVGDDWDEGVDHERSESVRRSKREQWTKPYISYVKDAVRYSRDGRFEDAARSLLRAHYKTTLDSHDEYLLMTWRIQVTLQNETEDEGTDYGLSKAIVILREFLEERKTPDENAEVERYGTATRRLRLRDANDDDDSDADMQWRSQRRVIRADLFAVLGSLYQLNGELPEARACFQHALSLRSDHAIAILNYLQLSVVVGEYEAALDACLHLLGMIVHSGKNDSSHASHRPSELPKTYTGLLMGDRSIDTMLPSVVHIFHNSEVASLAAQMVTLLKEYRGLVSAQIQANTAHIFKVQGTIAHVVQQLRLLVSKQAKEQEELTRLQDAAKSVDLSTFNETLEQYHEKIIANPTEFANATDFDDFYTTFAAQFAALCDEVAKTLPEENTSEDGDSTPTPNQDNMENQATEEETIDDFLAKIDRGRRQSTQARARPTTGDSAAPPARRTSSIVSAPSIRPQRPTSEPTNTPRRRRPT